jgi:hypothetical protein
VLQIPIKPALKLDGAFSRPSSQCSVYNDVTKISHAEPINLFMTYIVTKFTCMVNDSLATTGKQKIRHTLRRAAVLFSVQTDDGLYKVHTYCRKPL